ncbi:MAG TPA: hypothetical protein VFA98_09300 [Thermoanaerobaculia bacterium]|nr:hypothetical protein [Thermoanaerobaculia bacterium]
MNREAHQAFLLLRFGFTVAPIIAGLDKFLQLLTHWEKYLAPFIPNTLGIHPHTFMMIVGIVEIVAGLIVAVQPRWGGWIVAAWLCGIILNLVAVGGYLDIALRDLGLVLGAVALARLAEAEAEVHVPARA